ncbi:MAG: alkaline phosphatase [Xenococcaceae cyanobacterium]
MSGVVFFDDLTPENKYEYQIGWFFSELNLDDLNSAYPLDWSQANAVEFTTASEEDSRSRSFVLGSCRYLLRLFGGSWFDDRGDKIFQTILEQIRTGTNTDQVLMVGDQIYADDLNIVGADTTLDEYNRRYQEVFSQPYIRDLMSRVPTYMTLDDHEIEDNWPSNSSQKDWMTKYPAAIHSYLTYQLSHSPLFELSSKNKITGTPTKLWYSYRDGCCDFFVTDTRTERYFAITEQEKEIISEEQMQALQQWLADGSGRGKFVVSAVPFFPDLKSDSEDKWSGFPKQRTELLEFIRQNQVRRVVFLSGDVHASMSAELVSSDDPDFKVISIISSAFFWPYPHPTSKSFILSGTIPSNSAVNYEVVKGGPVYATDNFTRVTADLNSVKVEVFARKGELLGTKIHSYYSKGNRQQATGNRE